MRDGHGRRSPAQRTDPRERFDLRTRFLENLVDRLTDSLVGQIENGATPATILLHTSIVASGLRAEPSYSRGVVVEGKSAQICLATPKMFRLLTPAQIQ